MSKRRQSQTKTAPAAASAGAPETEAGAQTYVRRHMRFGWWSLLLFLTLGVVLEAMHGLKVDWYLNVANETRRLMWTLGHAHGTLLSLINIAFALTALHFGDTPPLRWRTGASFALIAATILLPGGFFLGGIRVYGGDPGPGVLLVPIGALFLIVAVLLIAIRTLRKTD